MSKAKKQKTKTITVALPEKLHTRLGLVCGFENLDPEEYIIAAIEGWVTGSEEDCAVNLKTGEAQSICTMEERVVEAIRGQGHRLDPGVCKVIRNELKVRGFISLAAHAKRLGLVEAVAA